MARTMTTMMVLVVVLLSADSVAAQTTTPADVVVIVPQGYEVTHTAVPQTATDEQQLAAPPPTQLQEPTLTVSMGETASHADARPTRARRGLVIGGSFMLAVGYVSNVIGTALYSLLRDFAGVSNTDEFVALSFVPVAGPWIQLPFASSNFEIGALIVAGALQAGGLTMIIAGLTFARRPVNEIAVSDGTRIRIDPMIGGDAAGLSATGTF